jgi:hypothetical protein
MVRWPLALATASFVVGGGNAYATNTVGVDVFSHLQRERIARVGDEPLPRAQDPLVDQLLIEPSSPYSATRADPAFTNDVEWPEVLAQLPGRLSSGEAVAVLHWDLGLTRARPGQDILPRDGFRDPFVGASATKADVDADIFWHMVDLTGFRHSTKAATYAVAMQILRRQLLESDPGRQASLGIDGEVFRRVMKAVHLDQVTTYDMEYLATLVQHRLIHWQVGDRATTGARALPTVFRVARVAAAYRDAQGYLNGYPCNPAATPRVGTAGTGAEEDDRPLCFVAATDRAVHRWYVDESDRQARWVPEREADGIGRLAGFLSAVLVLLDLAPIVEMFEAVAADDLVTAKLFTSTEADVAAERADRLFCPLPE